MIAATSNNVTSGVSYNRECYDKLERLQNMYSDIYTAAEHIGESFCRIRSGRRSVNLGYINRLKLDNFSADVRRSGSSIYSGYRFYSGEYHHDYVFHLPTLIDKIDKAEVYSKNKLEFVNTVYEYMKPVCDKLEGYTENNEFLGYTVYGDYDRVVGHTSLNMYIYNPVDAKCTRTGTNNLVKYDSYPDFAIMSDTKLDELCVYLNSKLTMYNDVYTDILDLERKVNGYIKLIGIDSL
ncbi:hypothetical protein HNP86_001831 [Methanococcus maripaludis]|uniref:Uncharacterized protein n=1 Tax=Methanococcus maripaludis TaxID=39152 RepID=A0A7J9NVG4_METMI|nr:hypothetical protein [Methanococcus maripaludis]MBA2851672.1 hypothetical protein [Methanococcus maripaludis]